MSLFPRLVPLSCSPDLNRGGKSLQPYLDVQSACLHTLPDLPSFHLHIQGSEQEHGPTHMHGQLRQALPLWESTKVA